jgi:hypothetical protein
MRRKLVIFTVIAALLTPIFYISAANDVTSVGPTNFEILSTDTVALKTIVEANGGIVTSLDVQSNYIDVALDNGSSAQFNTDGTVFFNIAKQSGADNYEITPACPTTSVTLSGIAAGTSVLRVRVYADLPACDRERAPVFPSNYSISVNSGAATTTSRSVTVHLIAQNADQVIVGNETNFLGQDWQSFSGGSMDISWTLTEGLGTKAVYAMFKSLTGDMSSIVSAGIELVAIPSTPPAETPPATTPPSTTPPPEETTSGSLTPVSGLAFGNLIKGTSSTVYYYAKDGKRYIFPNFKTYFSWYANFSTVKKITDSQLGEIPRGNNITYRPGVKMVKIELDPKVYAVDVNGTLRWVKTEVLAKGLYGDDWAKKVDDLPEIFFLNYKIGTPIETVADFNPAAATATAINIAADKGIN